MGQHRTAAMTRGEILAARETKRETYAQARIAVGDWIAVAAIASVYAVLPLMLAWTAIARAWH